MSLPLRLLACLVLSASAAFAAAQGLPAEVEAALARAYGRPYTQVSKNSLGYAFDRGNLSFVKVALAPTNTSSSRRTPSHK